jgi:2'-5' RNA ligase
VLSDEPEGAGREASAVVEFVLMSEETSARVFLATGISPTATGALAALQGALRARAPAGLFRFVEPAEAHVTLRFLGQRSPSEQSRVAAAAASAARASEPFTLAFGGLGVFPDERRPHTLWMALTQGRAEVVALAARLQAELELVGVAPEERPFVPHLTVARIKQRLPAGMVKALLAATSESPVSERVDSFSLMESRAVAGQVRYLPLRTFSLETACTPSK